MKNNRLRYFIIFFCVLFTFVSCLIFAKIDLAQENISSIAYVIFNEILANEPGSNTKLEWVELFNTDSIEHDLGGWLFMSEDNATKIPGGTVIPSGGFLIITRKLVTQPPDSISFEGYWGDGSGVWGDSPEEDFPAVEVKMSLINSGGIITLIDRANIARNFVCNEDCGDGISLEKISPESIDGSTSLTVPELSRRERLENWSCCIHPDKSTPGRINSVSPAENDLSIKSEELFSSSEIPLEDSTFSIIAVVRNAGTAKSLTNELTFFNDRDWDEFLAEYEQLGDLIIIPPLDVGEADTISIEVDFPKGNYRIYARIGKDEKDFNNQVFMNLKVRGILPDLVINEIIYNPDLDLSQTEWVELYNRSEDLIWIKNWLLGDSIEQRLITPDEMIIESKQFLIITEDKNKFRATYPEVDCEIIEQESWQSLNNTGDKVILKDSLNLLEEEVSYQNIIAEKGISWERMDYDLPASNEDNWWRCTDPAGATPGRENSLHTHYSDKIKLTITPNPFSPDGDGFEDEAIFKYTLPKMSELTLKVYDIRGRLIKTLMENEPQVTGEIIWDGKDDENRILRVGIYIVFAEAKGIINSAKKMTLVVAKR